MFVVVVIVLSSALSFDSAMCVGVGGIEACARLVFGDVIRGSWIHMQNVKKCKQ